MISPKISICMATYNGEKYLKEQLDSIFAQTNSDWKLLIRDDGSVDNSLGIIEEYTIKYPNRIVLVTDEDGRIGPCMSFARLLDRANTEYIMFCDQDDVWLPDKIEVSTSCIRNLEKQHGYTTPLLVHTDLTVVNSTLQLLAESFWSYQKVKPKFSTLNRTMVQNVVTGNTVIMNRSLADLATPIPDTAIMHDWWVTLVASAFGKISTHDKATVLYRQHEKNRLGAQRFGIEYITSCLMTITEIKKVVLRAQAQAASFLEQYQNRLSAEDSEMVRAFVMLMEYGPVRRRYLMLKYHLFKNNFLKNVGLFWVI